MIRSKEIAEALYILHDRSIQYIEFPLLQESLALYQNQAVLTMEMEHSHVIQSKVRDTGTYETQLNIHLLGNSHCTCRNREICTHLIAVYFAAYAFQGFRPELIVRKATELAGKAQAKPQAIAQPQRESSIPVTAHPKANPPKGNSHAPKANKLNKPKPTIIHRSDSVAVWHSYYHTWFKQFSSTNGFTDFNKNMNSMTLHFNELCQDWPPILRHFFMMHACLFQLQKLKEYSLHTPNTRSTYYYSFGINNAISDCYQGLIEQLKNLREAEPSNLTLPHREQTAALLSEIAFSKEKSPIDWPYFYRMIWNIVLKSANIAAPEKLRLQNELKQTKLSSNQRIEANMALAYHWFIEGNDIQAMSCLEEIGVKLELDHTFIYLDALEQNHETDRLMNWLLRVKPKLANTTKQVIEQYLDYWITLVPQSISEEVLLYHITDLLPGSSSYYINRLINQENFAALIDFMLANVLSISILPSGIIRKIESKQAELLLPYHHQMVESLISCKNRHAYIEAIKSMKKIQRIYRKIKQPESWDRYYGWIKSQYSRLSALQEEMQKGLK